MKVAFDLNVLLDVFQRREPHYAASAQLVAMACGRRLEAVFPAHGLTTLYYLVRNHATRLDAEAAMDKVIAHFEIGNLDRAGWLKARNAPMKDFEDAVVATVAEAGRCRFIVTRNLEDFRNSPVSAITPADFLSCFPEV